MVLQGILSPVPAPINLRTQSLEPSLEGWLSFLWWERFPLLSLVQVVFYIWNATAWIFFFLQTCLFLHKVNSLNSLFQQQIFFYNFLFVFLKSWLLSKLPESTLCQEDSVLRSRGECP